MTDHPSSGGHICNDCACQQQCLLGRLDPQTRAAWRGHLTERRFRKGEMLQRQGESIHSVQVVKIGTLLVQRRGDDGVEHPVGMAGCCEALGAPALLQQPADLSYVAVTPGRVCQLDLAPLLGAGRQFQGEFLLELAREQLNANARLSDWGRIARIRGVVGQLAGALLQLAELQRSTLVRLPSHTVLAALLATTRESVARALALLAQEQGVLRRDRWHCEIQRAPLLALTRGGRRSAANLYQARAAARTTPAAQAPVHAAL